ncbi:MAG: RluA family pseudouridine synthase [Deinococcales bacterium]
MDLDYRVFEAPAGERLDVALAQALATSRSHAKSLIVEGYVQLDGRPQEKASLKLSGKEIISVVLPPPKPMVIEPEAIPLEIVYEDEDMAVINKPPNLTAHPTGNIRTGTVINALMGRMALAKESQFNPGDEDYRPGIVHRLDKDTSGIMVIAKHDEAHRHLTAAFKQRLTEKEYVAIAAGKVDDEVHVDAPIGRNIHVGFKMMIGGNNPKHATTQFRVLARARHPTLGHLSLIKAKPHTGRTHQIRLHLLHLGAPILGDELYSQSSTLMPRQALHAYRLTLPHPKDKQPITFMANVPLDMVEAWLKVGGAWPEELG